MFDHVTEADKDCYSNAFVLGQILKAHNMNLFDIHVSFFENQEKEAIE